MSEVAGTPESYLRCVRRCAGPPEAQDVIDLKTFLEAFARPMAKYVFGVSSEDAITIENPATLDEQLEPNYRPVYQLSTAPVADVRGHDSVRAVLFDVRAPSTEENDRALSKAEARATRREITTSGKSPSRAGQSSVRRTRPNTLNRDLDDVQAELTGERGQLTIISSRIVIAEDRKDGFTRFALEATDSPSGDVLLAQSELIFSSLRQATAFKPIFSRKSPSGISLQSADPRCIEFMKVSTDNPGDPELFIDRLQEQIGAEGRPGKVGFQAHAPRWRSGLFHQ